MTRDGVWESYFLFFIIFLARVWHSAAQNPPQEHFTLQRPDLEAAFLPSNGSMKSKVCNLRETEKDSGSLVCRDATMI